jgi:predicted ester cyclase
VTETNVNKRVVERVFAEVISRGDLALADELIDPGLVQHDPRQPPGLEGFKLGLMAVREAFPDWTSTLDDVVCEGDKVAARWTVRGTHRGAFFGVPPTGKSITMREAGILRVQGEKLVEVWRVADELALLQQIGALPGAGGQGG